MKTTAIDRRQGTTTHIQTARTIARWMDRFYLDPLLGLLIPGAGDIVGGATGLYLVFAAIRARMPRVVIARMLINLAVDVAVGLIPFVGDLFDFVWRSNERNLALLERRASVPRSGGTTGDWAYVVGAAVLFLGVLMLPVLLLVWAIRHF